MNIIKTLFSFFFMLVLTFAERSFGQMKTNSDAHHISRITGTLSVPDEKAKVILDALNYKKDQVINAIQNESLKPKEKHALLKKLIQERQQKLDAVMTKEQSVKLMSVLLPSTETQESIRKRRDDKFGKNGKKVVRGGKLKLSRERRN